MAILKRPPLWALIWILVAGSASVAFAVVTSFGPKESLLLESFTIVSGTNAIISIQNTGTISVTFTSYTVRDSSNDRYALNNWGQTKSPNALVTVKILIGPSCPNCVLSGQPFTLAPGDNVTLVTARGNQFTFG